MTPRPLSFVIIFASIFSLAACASAQTGATRAPSARIAFVDAENMRDEGLSMEGDRVVEADLAAFAGGLNVKLFDVSRLTGSIFVIDERLDITDDFVSASKAKPSRSSRIGAPAREVPDAVVAFVDTDAFMDPARGITRLVDVSKTIEREFAPRREEIDKLKEQLANASGDEKKRLEAKLEKKQISGQTDIQRRWKEMSGPVFEEIMKKLKTFGKREGISMLFDLRNVKPGDKLAPYDLPLPTDSRDITTAFINAFNKGAL